jgi:hypothetical protein
MSTDMAVCTYISNLVANVLAHNEMPFLLQQHAHFLFLVASLGKEKTVES